MAEEQDKQDEEKFEFTPEGEVVGYISLEQARTLAIEHARDNPDFYGRRYARRQLSWEVLAEVEGEDYYYVRLSYRPSEGFRGQPGVESFTMDKAGPVRLRQIVSAPKPARGLMLALGGAGILVAVAATVAGLFAFPPSQSELGISLSPDAPARLVSSGGDVTVDVPTGAVANAARLSYRPVALTDIPVLPSAYTATQTVFDLTTDASLSMPITVTVRISAGDAVAAGSEESNLLLQQYAYADTTHADVRASRRLRRLYRQRPGPGQLK